MAIAVKDKGECKVRIPTFTMVVTFLPEDNVNDIIELCKNLHGKASEEANVEKAELTNLPDTLKIDGR